MQFLVLIIISVFLLNGCGTPPESVSASLIGQNAQRPRIPVQKNIPETNIINPDFDEMDILLKEIDKELNAPNITKDDIIRGWYYASKEDKKYGTPNSWIWISEPGKPRWTSPNALEEIDYLDAKNLCEQTAGTYFVSCLDTEIPDCQYVAKSECRCSDDTIWQDDQGCILINEDEEFIYISQDELRRGWYTGLPNQKKFNTPSNWIWMEGGQDSRWQTYNPQ